MSAKTVMAALLAGIVRGLRHPDMPGTNEAEERAWLIALAICDEMHPLGPSVIPSRDHAGALLKREERDDEIWQDFSGDNYGELAARWGLTERQVRRIVERRRSGIRGASGRC